MKFNPGDQVSFLDENLEGVVRHAGGDGVCRVEVEGGLEIEVHERSLVLLRKGPAAEIPVSSEMAAPGKEWLVPAGDPWAALEDDAFYFAAVPGEDMQVLTGPVRFYLVNKTPYEVMYGFTVSAGRAQSGVRSGTVAPGKDELICTRKRSELMDWKAMHLQALFYKEGAHDLLPPVNKELPVHLPDLNRSEQKLEGLWSYAKIVRLASAVLPAPDLSALKDKYTAPPQPAHRAAPPRPSRKPPAADDPGVLVNEKEVDLHIQHLADDYRNLTNAQMLQIQLGRFRREMDEAMRHHYRKLVFIHGVGNGVLRNEILRELKSWSGVVYHDAPFEKYGYGATEVVFL